MFRQRKIERFLVTEKAAGSHAAQEFRSSRTFRRRLYLDLLPVVSLRSTWNRVYSWICRATVLTRVPHTRRTRLTALSSRTIHTHTHTLLPRSFIVAHHTQLVLINYYTSLCIIHFNFPRRARLNSSLVLPLREREICSLRGVRTRSHDHVQPRACKRFVPQTVDRIAPLRLRYSNNRHALPSIRTCVDLHTHASLCFYNVVDMRSHAAHIATHTRTHIATHAAAYIVLQYAAQKYRFGSYPLTLHNNCIPIAVIHKIATNSTLHAYNIIHRCYSRLYNM